MTVFAERCTTRWGGKTPAQTAAVVMIVDDERPVRSLQRRFLAEAGFSVVDAEDGAGAIALATDTVRPDVVVADVQMPGMNGEELAMRLRAVLPGVKVLFVTGHADALFDLRPTLGADEAYLEKPFTRAGLVEAVSLLLYGGTRS
jgi:two-component system cell cycle sensor histidine kinase/response regulator CckA